MSSFTQNSNKYLLSIIVLLILVTGFQTYLILNKSDSSDSGSVRTQFEEDKLFRPDASIMDWDPFANFQRMQEQMDQVFGKGFSGLDSSFPSLKSFSFGGPFSQKLDLKDEDGKFVLELELPGLDRTNVDVSVEGKSLKISGTVERENERTQNNATFKSSQSQHFERYLTLPAFVKPETLRVDYKDKFLVISIEKRS